MLGALLHLLIAVCLGQQIPGESASQRWVNGSAARGFVTVFY